MQTVLLIEEILLFPQNGFGILGVCSLLLYFGNFRGLKYAEYVFQYGMDVGTIFLLGSSDCGLYILSIGIMNILGDSEIKPSSVAGGSKIAPEEEGRGVARRNQGRMRTRRSSYNKVLKLMRVIIMSSLSTLSVFHVVISSLKSYHGIFYRNIFHGVWMVVLALVGSGAFLSCTVILYFHVRILDTVLKQTEEDMDTMSPARKYLKSVQRWLLVFVVTSTSVLLFQLNSAYGSMTKDPYVYIPGLSTLYNSFHQVHS
jgi:hypothetical protein